MSECARPLVMGVVNVTPDSFSDGGRFEGAEAAIAHGRALFQQGADILDIGGESTRPGAAPVSEADELARVIPVIAGLAGSGARMSIDTMKPAVARAAIAAGAEIWNDVSALRFAPDSLATAAQLGCTLVLMHMQGEPRTMQTAPRYQDAAREVEAFLLERAAAAMAAGVARERIWLDPGIGFGKTLEHNLALLRATGLLASQGFPLLVGASRKRFIQAIDPSAEDAGDRLGGSLAAHLHAARHGAAVIRCHDVRETVQALKVLGALESGSAH